MTNAKEAMLYDHLKLGHSITHYEAQRAPFRMCDFRKAMTRMRKHFRKEGLSVESIWRYRAEGKKIIRYKEHSVGKSTHSAR